MVGKKYDRTTAVVQKFTPFHSVNLRTFRGTLLHSIHEEPWGQKTIRFFDPDRHLIEIGESLGTFVRRLYSEGMTPKQVSEKTGIPLEMVRKLLNR